MPTRDKSLRSRRAHSQLYIFCFRFAFERIFPFFLEKAEGKLRAQVELYWHSLILLRAPHGERSAIMNSSPPKRSPFLPWMLVAACLVAFGLAAYGGYTARMSDSYLPPAAPATLNEDWTAILLYNTKSRPRLRFGPFVGAGLVYTP